MFKEKLAVKELKKYKKKYGKVPTTQDWANAKIRPVASTITIFYGSWLKFINQCGYEYKSQHTYTRPAEAQKIFDKGVIK